MEKHLKKAKLYYGEKASDLEFIRTTNDFAGKKIKMISFYGRGNLMMNIAQLNQPYDALILMGVPADVIPELYDLIQTESWKVEGQIRPFPQIVVLIKQGEIPSKSILTSTIFRALFEVVLPEEEKYVVELTRQELSVLQDLVRREMMYVLTKDFRQFLNMGTINIKLHPKCKKSDTQSN